jgi:hypothetical protein
MRRDLNCTGNDTAQVLMGRGEQDHGLQGQPSQHDVVCIELVVRPRNQVFEVDEKAEGFWKMVRQIKTTFPVMESSDSAACVRTAETALAGESKSGVSRSDSSWK